MPAARANVATSGNFDKLVLRGLVLLLALLLALPAAAQLAFPPLTGRVVDAANVLPADVEASLDAKLRRFELETRRQLVVATVNDLGGTDIADYGYQLGRAWGLGDKGRNDGAILIVAPAERRMRIEVGYGLEPILTDALSSLIIQRTIRPAFKAGDLPGGIVAGTDAIIAQLSLPPEEAAANVAAAQRAQGQRGSREGPGAGALIWIALIFFFVVLPMLRRGGRRGRRGGMPIIFWPGGFGGGGGGGGGFGGFGGGGGGGFSGGGGSFGGGGSSGSW